MGASNGFGGFASGSPSPLKMQRVHTHDGGISAGKIVVCNEDNNALDKEVINANDQSKMQPLMESEIFKQINSEKSYGLERGEEADDY